MVIQNKKSKNLPCYAVLGFEVFIMGLCQKIRHLSFEAGMYLSPANAVACFQKGCMQWLIDGYYTKCTVRSLQLYIQP